MITLCATCGTSYDDRGNTLNHCRICEDERQYVIPGKIMLSGVNSIQLKPFGILPAGVKFKRQGLHKPPILLK